MDVQILSTTNMKPSSPTPQRLRNFKISNLDQVSPPSFTPILYYYDSRINPSNVSETLEHLKTSFAETLTIYYPLAGRLLEDLTGVDCNDEGALYIEAQTECSLSQFLEKPDMVSLKKFIPCIANCATKACDALVAVQITKFQCGGIVVGACMYHKVADISTMIGFMKNWAKIASGMKDQVDYPDLYTASQLFPPIESIKSETLTGFEKFLFRGPKNSMTKRYVFDAKALATLQDRSSAENMPRPSRVLALTAFICKRMMEGRGVEVKGSQPSMITHAVNLRRRIEPPLADNVFGNLLWLAYGVCEATGTETELSELVEVVKEMLININNESLKEMSSELVLEAMKDLINGMEALENLQILRFSSWCNYGIYEVNFGWGEPVWVSFMGDSFGLPSKQQFIFLDTKYGKGIEVWMSFDEKDIDKLENDSEFIEYAKLNPSISIA